MSRVFFASEAEGVATFWRIRRKDGVALGLTSHDRALRFDGIEHRAAPGMVPSAIRRTLDLSPDSAEVQGSLTHDSISAEDLATGRFDGAQVEVGLVDWETLERSILYRGEIGGISQEAGSFGAELVSAKSLLEADVVPRTSPTCRAQFCGPGCNLSALPYDHEITAQAIDLDANRVALSGGPAGDLLIGGTLRWIDGAQAGLTMQVLAADATGVILDIPLDDATIPGMRALVREGCDHTLQTCTARFANSVNFQGEPFLPGNDLLARYPTGT